MNIRAIFLFSLLLFVSCKEQKKTDFVFKIKDDLDREISFDKIPERIISLAPNITEIIYSLGCGDKLVGVTKYCNYPPEAQRKEIVGDLVSVNYEKIVSLKPDIIFITKEGNTKEVFNKIENLGIKTFVLDPRNKNGVCKSISDIGKIFNCEQRSAQTIRAIDLKLDSIKNSIQRVYRPKVLFLVSLLPLISVGENTFLNEIMSFADLTNITATTISNYPTINKEDVLFKNPDYIFIPSDLVKKGEEVLDAYPEFKLTNAAKNDCIKIVNADLLQRPGPRIADAVELISKMIREK